MKNEARKISKYKLNLIAKLNKHTNTNTQKTHKNEV